jgi:hypothetical protein
MRRDLIVLNQSDRPEMVVKKCFMEWHLNEVAATPVEACLRNIQQLQ